MNNPAKYQAVIPARGGSKRLPGKNIMLLQGKPLIAWTIEAALGCPKIDQVIVSSDDDTILKIAGLYDVKLIKRPDELSSDVADSFSAIEHAVNQYPSFEYTVLLQPTSPLRKAEHITEAISELEKKYADAVVSVCEVEHNPLWCNTLPTDNNMNNFLRDEVKVLRSQDLPIYYRLNGAIYICKTEKLLKEKGFFLRENIYSYKMSKINSVDIDTALDFKWAEYLLEESSYVKEN